MAVHHPGRNQNLRDLARVVKQMATEAIQNASFGSAGLRVYDGGWITIENGGLRVIGSAIISGILNITGKLTGSGTLDWTGPWLLKGKGTISGDTDITGKLDVTGNTAIKGDLDITGKTRLRGKTTLENDLEVTSGGKIKVGSRMTLNPASNGGSMEFSGGTEVFSDGATLRMSASGSYVSVGSGYASLQAGGNSVTVTSGGVRIPLDSLPPINGQGLPAGTLMVDSTGTLRRADGY